jgi:hypothetical protein
MQYRSWRLSTLCVAAVCGALACARGVQVESTAAPSLGVTPVNSRTLPAGVDMQLALDQPIGTSHSSVGQEFGATVIDAVQAQDGRIVVPAGAKVYGHVTGLHAGSIDKPAAIKLDFERLAFGGESHPFQASITATNLSKARESAVSGRDVGIGAVAGGVLGAIIGEGELGKIFGGALLGAGAGTVISLGTRGTEATLPTGTQITVRTTQTVALR